MKKKYIIKDEDGKVINIEEETIPEASEPKEPAVPAEPKEPEVHDEDGAFTPEQVETIKNIIREVLKETAPKAEPDVHDEDDKDLKVGKDNPENIIPKPTGDSLRVKRGPTSVEVKNRIVKDTAPVISREEEDNAWANRWAD